MCTAPAPAPVWLQRLSLFVLVLYRSSMVISSLKDANIALTQRLAILEFRIESHEEAETPGR